MEHQQSSPQKKFDGLGEFLITLQSMPVTDLLNNGDISLLLNDLGNFIRLVNMWVSAPETLDQSSKPRDFEARCQSLWNWCVRTRRDSVDKPSGKKTKCLLSAWLLSFLCLELNQTWPAGRPSEEKEAEYILRLLMSISKASVNDDELDIAKLAMQRGATYIDRWHRSKAKEARSLQIGPRHRLEADYFTMRIWLSWREDRLDVAEHMFRKTDTFRNSLDIVSIENMTEILQRIGSELLSKNNLDLGLKWLRRAYDLINPEVERASMQGQHLYLAICNDIIASFPLEISSEIATTLEGITQSAESILSDQPVLCHSSLCPSDLANKGEFNEDAYTYILRRLISSLRICDSSFPLILSYTKKLNDKNPSLALDLLDNLLLQHAVEGTEPPWVNKVLFLRIYLASNKTLNDEEFRHLFDVFDELYQRMSAPLTVIAAETCHALIWKTVRSLFKAENFQLAEFWCKLALSALFRGSNTQIIDRFARRLIICRVKQNEVQIGDIDSHGMPDFCGDDINLTHHLSFKASLLSSNHELLCKSIYNLTTDEGVHRSQDLLYACLSEPTCDFDQVCIVEALKSLIRMHDEQGSPSINLPLLLRCTIRVLQGREQDMCRCDKPCNNHQYAGDVCEIFGIAAKYAIEYSIGKEDNKRFAVQDLNWFPVNLSQLAIQPIRATNNARKEQQPLFAAILSSQHATLAKLGTPPIRNLTITNL
ncbi:hypothetical protein QQS21_006177 [Conoideocrella luteorostrata]|uniref:Uncharacterized protein n=1 Tax=Conoideocrella luteorostrata TaxID=1105319 RepID=A0AAJ0CS92_9HYPO|nr:hypothetical protein QQS21_006177 [Conoideocrella luteorostrata]